MAPDAFPAWSKTVKEVETHFKVDISQGLSDAEVIERRLIHGRNELSKAPPTPLWKLILEQVSDSPIQMMSTGNNSNTFANLLLVR